MPANKAGKPARDAKGRLLPGHSGNPHGVPKTVLEAQALLRETHLPAAMRRLSELIESDDEQIALGSAKTVLDFTVPKPKQDASVEVKADAGLSSALAQMAPDAIVAALKRLGEGDAQ